MARKRTMRDALLLAVCDAPDDDAPRLVFADWLEENGDENDRDWAEYIRLECEEARLADGDPRREAVSDRSRYLWNFRSHLGKGWDSLLPRGVRRRGLYERGFPESVACSALTFLRQAKRLFQV